MNIKQMESGNKGKEEGGGRGDDEKKEKKCRHGKKRDVKKWKRRRGRGKGKKRRDEYYENGWAT